MKQIISLLLLVVLTGLFSKTIIGEFTYNYSDAETLIDAKKKCLEMSKRDAVEKFATFIRSETVVKNYITENDKIISNSLGMITDIKVITEDVNRTNAKIYYKISAEINEDEVMQKLAEIERIEKEDLAKKREQEEKLRTIELSKLEEIEKSRVEAEKKKSEQEEKIRQIEIAKLEELQKIKIEAERKRLEQELRIKALEEEELLKKKLAAKDNPNRKFWTKQKWIALGTFVGTAGLGTYFSMQGESYYDDYQNATSSDKALDLYDQAENNRSYGNITYSVSLVPLGYFFYAWYKESRY